MSTVDKMLIKGIRSFDPENKHVITFFKPLTLIVGPNGAGKTTIIECLKLSCSGELPPNARSGHSFVHDPKVAGETETKAQIKLRFRTAAGKDVVCIRSFQLTQKASKMEFKAIDSVLQTINPHTGEKVCLSYRCADMDREIPSLMGVSKAILENVIFVHQDEANWPLQDPSTLKKKFDDIFSATRYTKALEVIKKLHKDQAQEIKTYKLQLENLQTKKDIAYKHREQISQAQEKANFLKSEMQGLEGMIQDVNTKIQYTDTKLKDLKKLEDQISQKTAVRSTLVNEREEKHKALEEENEDTDEELKEWKTKFEEKIALLETKIRKLEREENDAESKITFLEKTLKESIREISKLENEAEVHLCSKNERDSIIQKLFSRHNLGALPNPPFTNEVALNLTNRIKSRLLDLEKDLQNKKMSNEKELETTWDCYNDVKDRWKSIEAQKEAKEEIKNGLLKRIEEKKNERDSLELEVSNVDLSHIDEKEKNMHIELERKTNQYAKREFESTIRQKYNEMFSIEQMITVAKKEKVAMAVDTEDRTKLSMKKNDLENRKRQHGKIINENRERVRGVLKGRFPPEKDLRGEISKVLSAVTMEFDDLSTKSREAENEVNMLQTRIQEINNNIYKHRKDMDSKRRYIESKLQALDQQSFTVDYYPTVLDSAKEKRDVEKRKYNFADGMRQMFDPFERVARANHICPCCERPFSLQEEDEFVKKQRMNAASSAEKLKVLAAESSTADSFFQQLDRLRMVYEEYVNIGKERIPNAERELHDLNQEMEQKSYALDDVLAVLAQVKAEKDSIQALMEPIENADRLFQDIQREQKLVDELAHKLEQGHGARSMQDIETELDNLLETKDNLHREVMQLRTEQTELQDNLSAVRNRWHNIREEKVKAANLLSDVKRAEEELERLTEEKNRVDLDEKLLAESLRPLSKEKDKLLGYHNDLKVKLNREYDEQAERKREYEQEVEALNMINLKIKEYNDSKKGEKLQEIQEKQHLLESQLQSCKTRKKEILAELNKSKDLRGKQDQVRRNIEDNLSYRKTKAEVEELTHELESLEDKMLKIGRKPKVQAELEKLSHEREEFLKRLNQNEGIISAHQSEISKHKIDLKNPDYKDIDKRYFDQLIQLKTTEMANKDLDRYYNALDKALMRFHSMKMEEINKIIRELWQQTYRGQDIDYICIHSDSDGAGTRSYSYKVLMQTGDTELEMRGRCSAGQKVLASLIIRLALAETFCLNCGILALDEPTTNLDGPNADSLAAALHRIMEDRKGQENFQLIVITHDERFAQLIGQRQHAEKYYRVAKDDHQHSIIEAQEIFD
ncbi:DNA repair protein RAD50 [Pyrus ussuriensis x Pyrus communis]|uniref:DNA repair protein RAD50 n=1 Tax=Pyrus ussuriensis x Pyrus communis TaxID=2448454 RepID=A0A5N5H7Z8_9ROSA|nr:DNA repair protein RAD50 [Pyrus ussuriensis x Pyrus communis]